MDKCLSAILGAKDFDELDKITSSHYEEGYLVDEKFEKSRKMMVKIIKNPSTITAEEAPKALEALKHFWEIANDESGAASLVELYEGGFNSLDLKLAGALNRAYNVLFNSAMTSKNYKLAKELMVKNKTIYDSMKVFPGYWANFKDAELKAKMYHNYFRYFLAVKNSPKTVFNGVMYLKNSLKNTPSGGKIEWMGDAFKVIENCWTVRAYPQANYLLAALEKIISFDATLMLAFSARIFLGWAQHALSILSTMKDIKEGKKLEISPKCIEIDEIVDIKCDKMLERLLDQDDREFTIVWMFAKYSLSQYALSNGSRGSEFDIASKKLVEFQAYFKINA